MLPFQKTLRPLATLTCVVLCGAVAQAQATTSDDNYPAPYDRNGNGGGVRGVTDDAELEVLLDPSRTAIPRSMQDPVFAHYVDLSLISRAIAAQNAALLVDVALQLGEGERVLLRNHFSGITSAGLLSKAVRSAAESSDNATLERLNRVAEATGNQELKAMLQATKLVSSSRGVDPDLVIDPSEIDVDVFERVRSLQTDIGVATFSGDAPMLHELKTTLKELAFPAQISKALEAQIDRALAICTQEPSSTDKALSILNSESRGWLQNATGVKTPDPIRKIAPNGLSIGGGQQSTSNLMVYTPASIDRDGNIWSGANDTGSRNQKVGRATAKFHGNECWWYANYKDAKSPVRAYPKYDRAGGSSNTGGSIEFDQGVSKKFSYTLINQSGRAVQLALPGDTRIMLADGEWKSFNYSGPADGAKVHVVNSGKRYALSPGSFKFYWMKNENRIGFTNF